jgi:hypothetical protein
VECTVVQTFVSRKDVRRKELQARELVIARGTRFTRKMDLGLAGAATRRPWSTILAASGYHLG